MRKYEKNIKEEFIYRVSVYFKLIGMVELGFKYMVVVEKLNDYSVNFI